MIFELRDKLEVILAEKKQMVIDLETTREQFCQTRQETVQVMIGAMVFFLGVLLTINDYNYPAILVYSGITYWGSWITKNKNFDPDNAPSVRRSSRLANKTTFLLVIADWPAEKILATLDSHNIQSTLGISHEELFQFFLENIPGTPATPSTPTPSGSRKATAKRKHSSRSTNPPALKKRTERSGNITQLESTEDPVLSALQNITFSLTSLDARIQAKGNQPSFHSTSSPPAPMAPVAAADAAPSTSFIMGPADLLLRRSLATVLPASTTGAPVFPPAAAISS
ncbi:unnamed protein product [Leuciscus chuanchicus]